MPGYLKLIIGPMFAGKSTELIRIMRMYKAIGKNILPINHILNDRYGSPTNITTHNEDIHRCIAVKSLSEVKQDDLMVAEVIAIEELQFFPDAFEKITHWVDVLGKTVIAAGLDGDFERNPFGDVLKLIPHCNEVIKVNAYCSQCKDGTFASFSLRHSDTTTSQLLVGSKVYEPVCRYHYLKGVESNNETLDNNTFENIQVARF